MGLSLKFEPRIKKIDKQTPTLFNSQNKKIKNKNGTIFFIFFSQCAKVLSTGNSYGTHSDKYAETLNDC